MVVDNVGMVAVTHQTNLSLGWVEEERGKRRRRRRRRRREKEREAGWDGG